MWYREEEYSWVWHPFYGSFSERGYGNHYLIFERHPELRTVPMVKDEDEQEQVVCYDPPRGYCRVNAASQSVYYSRYDQSRFGTRGTNDAADAQQLDSCIRKAYGIPKTYMAEFAGYSRFWVNVQLRAQRLAN